MAFSLGGHQQLQIAGNKFKTFNNAIPLLYIGLCVNVTVMVCKVSYIIVRQNKSSLKRHHFNTCFIKKTG